MEVQLAEDMGSAGLSVREATVSLNLRDWS